MLKATLIFVSQDGIAPSGVSAYGYHLLSAWPGAHFLLLNAVQLPRSAPADLVGRITCVGGDESHDVGTVVVRLGDLLTRLESPIVILPNTGDTSWSATMGAVCNASPRERARLRVLGIVHSDVETQYELAERYLPIAPVWIGVSRRCADELRRRVGRRGAVVHELPYPIELRKVSGNRSPSEPLRLAYAGRIEEPQKRVSRIAELFARLIETKVDFRATVAGDGPARHDFERMVDGLGPIAADCISLIGTVDGDGVQDLWRTHDVCLLASAFEGLPLALLEAMAAGACPVVMAVQSGLPELLEDGVNGRVVPQGDVAGMAEVIAELADDRAQVARLGAAARSTVAARFSPEAHFQRLAAIIDELWATPAPDPAAVAVDPTVTAVADITTQLRAIGKPSAVFGAGMFGRKVVDACVEAGVEVCGLFDSDPSRRGWSYRGMSCAAPEELPSIGDAVVVVGSMQFFPEMRDQVIRQFREAGLETPVIISART